MIIFIRRFMTYRLGRRIFLGYLAVIAVVVALMVLGVDQFMRRQLVDIAAQELVRELALAEALYQRDDHLHPDVRAENIAGLVGLRVTVITPGGQVVGDSDVPFPSLPELEDHSGRPEFRAAVRGGRGRDVRRSRSVGRDLVYLAARLDDGTVLRLARPLDEVHRIVRQVQTGVGVIGLLAVLVAALLTFLLSRTVTAPIRRMAASAQIMGEGDLGRTIEAPRIQELGELAAALNTLSGDLRRRIGELEHERAEMQVLIDSMREGVLAFEPNGTLRQANPSARSIFSLTGEPGARPEEISRRSALGRLVREALGGDSPPTAELRERDRDLLATARPLPDGGAVVVVLDISERRRADAIRREFVANASHELKTPLTTLRGYTETLLDESLPPETRMGFLEIVRRNAERMQRIVDDLLDLSRIEGGRWEPRPEVVDARALTAEILDDLTQRAEEHQVDLTLEVEEAASSFRIDPSAYRLIVTNLVDNAIRYSPEGGGVAVHLRSGGEDHILLSVEDRGVGIPASHLPRIFERFYRVDAGRSRAGGGTGLGLSIVKHLAEVHGGRVWAESELGAGTTVHVEIPQASAPDPQG